MPVYLTFGVHNHQPIGNFDWVLEDHYRQAYLPFLDVIEAAASFPFSLHTSGPLLLWLIRRHPDYVERVRRLVMAGRVEVKGGSLYEAILPLIPREDRHEQLTRYSTLLEETFGRLPEGSWLTERVWEPSLARDLAEAGLGYSVVDDSHFAPAGKEGRLAWGYYLTEDQGYRFDLFPISKDLRYLIPFQEPSKTIGFLRRAIEEDERARAAGDIPPEAPPPLLVYDDDGEKFGGWPGTHEQVYKKGWLLSFLGAVEKAVDEGWLRVTTPGAFRRDFDPMGRVYLPPSSYAEMLEWSSGFFPNFLVRYEEANRLHKRMLDASARSRSTRRNSSSRTRVAREAVLRAQCNDVYWHGVFGGLYLPHLRQAAYANLIEAERDLPSGPPSSELDIDFDGHQEIRLRSRTLLAYLSPARGGSLMSLDHLTSGAALLDTLRRRLEPEHDRLREAGSVAGATEPTTGQSSETASIHERVVVTEKGLERHLHGDPAPRDSLFDHFYTPGFDWESLLAGSVDDQSSLALRSYQWDMADDRAAVTLRSQGVVMERSIALQKTIELLDEPSRMLIRYRVEVGERIPRKRETRTCHTSTRTGADKRSGDAPPAASRAACSTPSTATLHQVSDPGPAVCFVPEFNINLLGAWSEEYGVLINGRKPDNPRLADGGTDSNVSSVALYDGNRGIVVSLDWAETQPATVHRYGVITVSLSEKGYEKIYQATCLAPAWRLQLDAGLVFELDIQVSVAQDPAVVSRIIAVR